VTVRPAGREMTTREVGQGVVVSETPPPQPLFGQEVSRKVVQGRGAVIPRGCIQPQGDRARRDVALRPGTPRRRECGVVEVAQVHQFADVAPTGAPGGPRGGVVSGRTRAKSRLMGPQKRLGRGMAGSQPRGRGPRWRSGVRGERGTPNVDMERRSPKQRASKRFRSYRNYNGSP